MKPIPPGGVMLLDPGQAGGLLGSGDRLRLCESRGYITAITTPRGPCYREDELLELRAAWDGTLGLRGHLRAGQAAYVLGVNAKTLRVSGWGKTLSRDAQGYYDAEEVRAVKAGRDVARRRQRDPERVPA